MPSRGLAPCMLLDWLAGARRLRGLSQGSLCLLCPPACTGRCCLRCMCHAGPRVGVPLPSLPGLRRLAWLWVSRLLRALLLPLVPLSLRGVCTRPRMGAHVL